MPLDLLEYRPNALRVARRYRGLGIDADDLDGLAMLGLCRAAKKHRSNGHADSGFKGYVEHWVRGEIGRALDTECRHPRPTAGLGIRLLPDRTSRADPGELALTLLGRLDDDQARAIELHLGLDGTAGRTTVDVAHIMEITHSRAYSLVHRGLARLRRALSESEGTI